MGKEASWWWAVTVSVIVLAFQYVFAISRYQDSASTFMLVVYIVSLPIALVSVVAHNGYFKAFLFLLIWLFALFYMIADSHFVELLVAALAVAGYAAATTAECKD